MDCPVTRLPTILPTKLPVTLLLALALAAGARAQSGDPTLPPPGLDALAAGAEAPPAVPAGPELQSVLVSREPGGRRIAVISGEMVRQGGRFQGAFVESVREDRVVLRRGKARETLRLYQPAAALPAGGPSPKPPAAREQQ